MDQFRNKVAVITGAASGIGRGMAETFADAGMRVVLSDVEEAVLHSTTDALRAGGADVHAVVTDVSVAADVTVLAESTLREFGAVHVLCNNAGIFTGSRPSWESTLDDWAWILGVNLMGVVHGIRAFLPVMIEQNEDAHIVNTASMAGLLPGGSLYGATKTAVVALSETLHFELLKGDLRPRVSVLCPGLVDTRIHDSARNRPPRYPDAGPTPDHWSTEAARQAFRKHGLPPRTVGDQVLQAIREQRFYVLTHPEYAKHVEHRARQITAGENPTLLPPLGT
ncbi:SDR family NAD(P)-dependent oxidoreductase [Streptomyces rimosus]|uniref:SDR family NAD(P)-dependent oxidoreductase n=1 Tax=Streptomyces rimosus TaxID=1927 RepID=UPI00067BBA1B|nr:SDR family NAD(P)-dependent oxidoreductase [Streptomyces rimosus]